jgi:hypothetical protein
MPPKAGTFKKSTSLRKGKNPLKMTMKKQVLKSAFQKQKWKATSGDSKDLTDEEQVQQPKKKHLWLSVHGREGEDSKNSSWDSRNKLFVEVVDVSSTNSEDEPEVSLVNGVS